MLVGTTNLNTTLNLTYVLTDVVETLLYDLRSEMGKQGYELRYDAKRNFNTAIAAIRKLKQMLTKPSSPLRKFRQRLRLSSSFHPSIGRPVRR